MKPTSCPGAAPRVIADITRAWRPSGATRSVGRSTAATAERSRCGIGIRSIESVIDAVHEIDDIQADLPLRRSSGRPGPGRRTDHRAGLHRHLHRGSGAAVVVKTVHDADGGSRELASVVVEADQVQGPGVARLGPRRLPAQAHRPATFAAEAGDRGRASRAPHRRVGCRRSAGCARSPTSTRTSSIGASGALNHCLRGRGVATASRSAEPSVGRGVRSSPQGVGRSSAGVSRASANDPATAATTRPATSQGGPPRRGLTGVVEMSGPPASSTCAPYTEGRSGPVTRIGPSVVSGSEAPGTWCRRRGTG